MKRITAKKIYQSIMSRCYDEKNKYFQSYGGKGIKVCDEWQDEEVFIKWIIEQTDDENVQMIRKNKKLGYNPKNVEIRTAPDGYMYKKKLVQYGEMCMGLNEWDIFFDAPKGLFSRVIQYYEGHENEAVEMMFQMREDVRKINPMKGMSETMKKRFAEMEEKKG